MFGAGSKYSLHVPTQREGLVAEVGTVDHTVTFTVEPYAGAVATLPLVLAGGQSEQPSVIGIIGSGNRRFS